MLKVKRQLPSSMNDELHRLWEDTDKKLERCRLPDQDNWKRDRRGISIHSNELIRRVKAMNPSVWAEDSINLKEQIGLYYASAGLGIKRYSGAHFKRGMVREFSQVSCDRADLPTGIEYGWREVLHRLLKVRLVSWRQILEQFPIYDSPSSEAFDRQVQRFKN